MHNALVLFRNIIDAAVFCQNDGSRLASVGSCEDLQSFRDELISQGEAEGHSFMFGIFSGALGNTSERRLTSQAAKIFTS